MWKSQPSEPAPISFLNPALKHHLLSPVDQPVLLPPTPRACCSVYLEGFKNPLEEDEVGLIDLGFFSNILNLNISSRGVGASGPSRVFFPIPRALRGSCPHPLGLFLLLSVSTFPIFLSRQEKPTQSENPSTLPIPTLTIIQCSVFPQRGHLMKQP